MTVVLIIAAAIAYPIITGLAWWGLVSAVRRHGARVTRDALDHGDNR
jgi:hypothetical protein